MINFYSIEKKTTEICQQPVLQTKFMERSMKLPVLEYPECASITMQSGHGHAYQSSNENTRTQLPICLPV